MGTALLIANCAVYLIGLPIAYYMRLPCVWPTSHLRPGSLPMFLAALTWPIWAIVGIAREIFWLVRDRLDERLGWSASDDELLCRVFMGDYQYRDREEDEPACCCGTCPCPDDPGEGHGMTEE